MSWNMMNKADKITAIEAVWQNGMSATLVALALSRHLGEVVGRSAVLGFYHRNPQALARTPLRPAGVRATAVRVPPAPKKAKLKPRVEPATAKPVAAEAAKFLPLHRLGNGCKWPIMRENETWLFCGCTPEPGFPYCIRHHEQSGRRADEPTANRA